VTDWPSEFVIISAFATTGESWTTQENEDADHRLASELRSRGGWFARIVAYSPTTGHAEPSWAVDLALDEGFDFGRRFRQDAIYHVKEDELSVARCNQGVLVRVGSFRQRLDVRASVGTDMD
jgi:hypothetical protein